MAERAPMLEWGRHDVENRWFRLSAFPSSDRSGEFYWTAWLKIGSDLERRIGDGYAATLPAAQRAAEGAAFGWLTEAVESFGGRVLAAEQVQVFVERLRGAAECARDAGVDRGIYDDFLNGARELEGGAHG